MGRRGEAANAGSQRGVGERRRRSRSEEGRAEERERTGKMWPVEVRMKVADLDEGET